MERLAAGQWQWPLNLDKGAVFDFACSSCGSCCRGEMTIHLNLADLQRMAGYLEYSTTARLFEDGVVEELKREIGFRPAIRFRQMPEKFCPFLENVLDDKSWTLSGRCKLHPHLKPLVCKLAPLGRELSFDENLRVSEQWLFTEPVRGCPGCRVGQRQLGAEWSQSHAQELELELSYFHIMEVLTREHAPMQEFRAFHRNLKVEQNVAEYLDEWQHRSG